MNSLPNLLSPLKLKLDDLLLDANNPRFSELGEELNPFLRVALPMRKFRPTPSTK